MKFDIRHFVSLLTCVEGGHGSLHSGVAKELLLSVGVHLLLLIDHHLVLEVLKLLRCHLHAWIHHQTTTNRLRLGLLLLLLVDITTSLLTFFI